MPSICLLWNAAHMALPSSAGDAHFVRFDATARGDCEQIGVRVGVDGADAEGLAAQHGGALLERRLGIEAGGLRAVVAEAAGFDAKAPLAKRAEVLRGKSFGSAPSTPIRTLISWRSPQARRRAGRPPRHGAGRQRHVGRFKSKQIDGMSNSPPWPLKPVVDGLVVIASGPDGDPPNAIDFAYNVVLAKPETCEKRRGLRRHGPGDEGGRGLHPRIPTR